MRTIELIEMSPGDIEREIAAMILGDCCEPLWLLALKALALL